jgi:hypothetical protein
MSYEIIVVIPEKECEHFRETTVISSNKISR